MKQDVGSDVGGEIRGAQLLWWAHRCTVYYAQYNMLDKGDEKEKLRAEKTS